MSKAQNDDSDYFFDARTFFENVKFLEVGLFMLNFLLNKKLSNATIVYWHEYGIQRDSSTANM